MTSSLSTGSAARDLPPDVEKQGGDIKAVDDSHSTSDTEDTSNPDEAGRTRDKWSVAPELEVLDTEAEGASGTISRVLSRISTNASWDPGPPPDGGRAAWLCGTNPLCLPW